MFTSIPPRARRLVGDRDFGPAWQAACVESWRRAGFGVVSLNSAQEIESLRGTAPAGVAFVRLPDGATVPRIVDFLDAARESGAPVAGIVNADCMMIPQTGLAERLADGLGDVVIVERINVDRETLRPTGRHCYGFDGFFFPTQAVGAAARDESWRIGDTWWDYWLPIAFRLGGVGTRTLPAPALIHLDHDVAWDKQGWIDKCGRLLDYVRASRTRPDNAELAALFDATPVRPGEQDVHALSLRIFAWLRACEPLWRPERASVDDLVASVLNALATSPHPETTLAAPPAATRPLRRMLARFGLS